MVLYRTIARSFGDSSFRSLSNPDDNKKSIINFDWEVKYNRSILRFIGLWPFDDSFQHFKFFICFAFMTIFALPVFSRTLFAGTSDIIKTMIEVVPVFYVLLQTIIFKYKNVQVKMILMRIYEHWDYFINMSAEHRTPMIVYSGKNRSFTVVTTVLLIIVWIVYFAHPASMMLITGNVTDKTLPMEGVYPFDTSVSPSYEIVYALQTLWGLLCGISIISVDGFLILASFHACAQLAVLCKTIVDYTGRARHVLLPGDISNKQLKISCPCLKCIVDNHDSVSSFIETIDDIFSSIIMARLIMNTSNFCGLGYTIIKSTKDNVFSEVLFNAIYFTAMTSNLFLYCWISEQLIQEGQKVGEILYELDWYNNGSKTAQTLLLPILRSRKPLKITAGKFFVMSLKCYQEWFVTAFGYLSVIWAVKSGT